MNYEGTYKETRAILAAAEEDKDELDRILMDMTDREISELEMAARRLAFRCEKWRGAGVEL